MSTKLKKQVINNIAPITLDECVYMSDGTTLKDKFLNIGETNWSNFKWVAFGDSITDETIKEADRKYCHIIAEKTGINMVNFGVGGTGYKRRESDGACFYQRMANIPADADIITILGSVNDWTLFNEYNGSYDGFVQGNVTDTLEDNTLCGYINKCIDVARETAPNAKIGIISPNTSFLSEKYVGMIRETLPLVAKHRGIPYLDLASVDQLRPTDATFGPNYFYDYNTTGGSIVHPNNEGHMWMYPPILAFMKSILG